MSANTEDPESTIPWPGFVDILSTVIIVFVFFMMMTSVIIFALSQEQQKKAVQEAVDAKNTQAKQLVQETSKLDVRDLLKENKQLKEDLYLLQAKSVLSESKNQVVRQVDSMTMNIDYGDFGVTLLPDTIEKIQALLPIKNKIFLQSVISSDSKYGSMREIGLNRALNIRNVLIQRGVPSADISLKLINSDQQISQDSIFYGQVIISVLR
jgi:hypothetical protein